MVGWTIEGTNTREVAAARLARQVHRMKKSSVVPPSLMLEVEVITEVADEIQWRIG
jgi:hypothetical protein